MSTELSLAEQRGVAAAALRGWITEETAQGALAEAPHAPLRALLERGLLRPEQVRELLGQELGDPTTRVGAPPAPSDTLTEVAPAPPARPRSPATRESEGTSFGPYRLVQELGRGGMGVVYRAVDLRIDRTVALKMMLGGALVDDTALQRFHREVTTVSKLKHANIVTIYEVGSIASQKPEGGRANTPYCAMEHISGGALNQALQRSSPLPPRAAARIARDVALALAHAHENGIIHRDLKPGNILIEPLGEGSDSQQTMVDGTGTADPSLTLGSGAVVRRYRVVLTDFGLARDISSDSSLTLSGHVLGTPAYMSPEQARGETKRLDGRSDVYSLGAVLYEMLCGRPPFSGESPALIVLQAISEDPIPLRSWNPSVHPDLETISAKAMNRDPSRRYPTAQALAADLDRFLRGDLIQARPVTRWERAWRRVRRNPVVSLLTAAVAVFAIAAGTMGWVNREQRRSAQAEQERLVQDSLRGLELSGKALVDAALARRAVGDIKGSRAYAASLDEPVRRLMALAPGLAEPWFHLGRKQRALGEEDAAERSQDEAVRRAKAGTATGGSRAILPFALYERGILRANRYRRESGKVRDEMLAARSGGRDPSSAAPSMPTASEVEQARPDLAEAKRGATDDLREVAALTDADERLKARADAARGILAVLTGGPREEARRLLAKALADDPYLEEVYGALAALAEEQGAWKEAAEWYRRGHDVDRGYSPHVIGLASCLLEASGDADRMDRGGDDLRRQALDVLREATVRDADRGELWSRMASVHYWCGVAAQGEGRDPTASYDAAVGAAVRACGLAPSSVDAPYALALALRGKGEWKARHGEDPLPEYEHALAVCTRALEVNARSTSLAGLEGILHGLLGKWSAGRGGDPGAEYRAAQARFEGVLAIDPRDGSAANGLAIAHAELGRWLRDHGKDPVTEFREAIEAFRKALSLHPGLPDALRNEAAIHRELGRWLGEHGQDPTDEYQGALTLLGEALAADPRFAEAYNDRAALRLDLAAGRTTRGQDPIPDYEKALADAEKAVAANPVHTGALCNAGILHGLLAESRGAQGIDPVPDYEKGIAAYERALSVDPRLRPAAYGLAWLFRRIGDALRDRDVDPCATYEKAIAACGRLLDFAPQDYDAIGVESDARAAIGGWKRAHARDPMPDYRAALAGYERALAVRPADPGASNALAVAHKTIASALRERGQDASSEYAEALAWCEKTLHADPRYWPAYANRGLLLEEIGKAEEALRAYEEMERIEEGRALAVRLQVNCHLRLACETALASKGKTEPGGEERPVAEDEARRCRDAAFSHLSKAVSLGWKETDKLRLEPSLEPLRADPRWTELLRRVGR